MQERVELPKNPIPQINYFQVFNLDIDTPVDELKRRYAELVRTLHPDGKGLAHPEDPKAFAFARTALSQLRELAKHPADFETYRNQFRSTVQDVEHDSPLESSVDEQRIGSVRLRKVRNTGLVSVPNPHYKLVDPVTNEVMGSRSFLKLRLVGYSLVGTYYAGMGQRETLVDPHTGEAFGSSFQKIYFRNNKLIGEAYNTFRYIDPVSGAVSAQLVDIRI